MSKPTSSYVHNFFQTRTKNSSKFMEQASDIMPNGVTANIKSFSPYPLVMEKADGPYVIDVDGNRYVDYLLSYGAQILGHGHERIKRAVINQMEQDGTNLFGTPHQLEIELGKKIKELYPSMELLRYTNSGTEATLLALRLAAAYSGKSKVAKFEGHYHGGYDQMLFSISPSSSEYGKEEAPKPVKESKGIDHFYEENILILPFNNSEHTEYLLRQYSAEIGTVIIEPVQAGFIPALPSFLRMLRRVTAELGIVLIFDEVKTGFRIGLGGAQNDYGITPDLTTLGKAIGGGFPIGIVGGKKEILLESAASYQADIFDSSQKKASSAKEVLFHSGTYNGHPTILAAGLAVLEVLQEEEQTMMAHTKLLKSELEKLFSTHDIPMQAVGKGTIFSVVLTERSSILTYRDYQTSNLADRKTLDYLLLEEGVYTKPLNRYSMSAAHGKREIEHTLYAYEKAIGRLKK